MVVCRRPARLLYVLRICFPIQPDRSSSSRRSLQPYGSCTRARAVGFHDGEFALFQALRKIYIYILRAQLPQLRHNKPDLGLESQGRLRTCGVARQEEKKSRVHAPRMTVVRARRAQIWFSSCTCSCPFQEIR